MVGGFTVIIMQVSVQIGLNLTGLELSLAKNKPSKLFEFQQFIEFINLIFISTAF